MFKYTEKVKVKHTASIKTIVSACLVDCQFKITQDLVESLGSESVCDNIKLLQNICNTHELAEGFDIASHMKDFDCFSNSLLEIVKHAIPAYLNHLLGLLEWTSFQDKKVHDALFESLYDVNTINHLGASCLLATIRESHHTLQVFELEQITLGE